MACIGRPLLLTVKGAQHLQFSHGCGCFNSGGSESLLLEWRALRRRLWTLRSSPPKQLNSLLLHHAHFPLQSSSPRRDVAAALFLLLSFTSPRLLSGTRDLLLELILTPRVNASLLRRVSQIHSTTLRTHNRTILRHSPLKASFAHSRALFLPQRSQETFLPLQRRSTRAQCSFNLTQSRR